FTCTAGFSPPRATPKHFKEDHLLFCARTPSSTLPIQRILLRECVMDMSNPSMIGLLDSPVYVFAH
ncbi:hypothetical protein KUCAC02_029658, partial [Chaenocephalus aceratus]